jgi:hypothetical protein
MLAIITLSCLLVLCFHCALGSRLDFLLDSDDDDDDVAPGATWNAGKPRHQPRQVREKEISGAMWCGRYVTIWLLPSYLVFRFASLAPDYGWYTDENKVPCHDFFCLSLLFYALCICLERQRGQPAFLVVHALSRGVCDN